MKDKARVGILSLGCPRNLVDSENILGRLSQKGYPVTGLDKADIGIVNTCAFIDDASEESIDAVLDLIDLKRKGRLKKIIVYGCLTQRYREKLQKELPEVDAFVGTLSFPALAGSRQRRENHRQDRFPLTDRHYAYLKICEGCINNCSYCVIPKIKRGFNSLDIESLLDKVEILDSEKIAELNIIGQDITGYGIDLYGRTKLVELLGGIIKKAKNIGWIRLLYLYPSRITDALLDLMRDQPKLCKYIDLPLQHANDRILKLMHRDTAKIDILNLIEKIRKKIPGVSLRTSLIVGFPSETDKEFKELIKFIEEVKFERLGAFIYSREEGTPAYNFKKQIPHRIKLERFNILMSKQQIVSEEINKKFKGETLDILIDEKENGRYLGRTQYDAPEVDGLVYINSKRELKPGDFVKARIADTLEYDLVGEVVE